jgi:hypothetical protein
MIGSIRLNFDLTSIRPVSSVSKIKVNATINIKWQHHQSTLWLYSLAHLCYSTYSRVPLGIGISMKHLCNVASWQRLTQSPSPTLEIDLVYSYRRHLRVGTDHNAGHFSGYRYSHCLWKPCWGKPVTRQCDGSPITIEASRWQSSIVSGI